MNLSYELTLGIPGLVRKKGMSLFSCDYDFVGLPKLILRSCEAMLLDTRYSTQKIVQVCSVKDWSFVHLVHSTIQTLPTNGSLVLACHGTNHLINGNRNIFVAQIVVQKRPELNDQLVLKVGLLFTCSDGSIT